VKRRVIAARLITAPYWADTTVPETAEPLKISERVEGPHRGRLQRATRPAHCFRRLVSERRCAAIWTNRRCSARHSMVVVAARLVLMFGAGIAPKA
jgi:hypothetical protein